MQNTQSLILSKKCIFTIIELQSSWKNCKTRCIACRTHCIVSLSDWIACVSHCIVSRSHCIVSVSHSIARPSHWILYRSHSIVWLSRWITRSSYLIAGLSYFIVGLSHWIAQPSKSFVSLSDRFARWYDGFETDAGGYVLGYISVNNLAFHPPLQSKMSVEVVLMQSWVLQTSAFPNSPPRPDCPKTLFCL